jgi:hypothetical protein
MLTVVVGGYYLTRLGLDVRLEYALLIAATTLSCFVTYEIVGACHGFDPGLASRGFRQTQDGPRDYTPAPELGRTPTDLVRPAGLLRLKAGMTMVIL